MQFQDMDIQIKENTYKVPKEFKRLLDELKLRRDLDLIDQKNYYSTLVELRDKYLEKGTQDWWRYTKQIITYQKKLIKEQKDEILSFFGDIAKHAGKSMDEVLRLQQKMSDKLKGYGALYDDIVIHAWGKTKEYTSLRDLSADILKLEEYKKALLQIKDRGAGQEFFGALRDMDIDEAISLSNKLLSLDDEGFRKYISDWQKKQEKAEEIASLFYQKERDDVIANLTESLKQAGLEVPEGFFDCGIKSAQSFGKGFISTLNSIIEDIKAELSMGITIPAAVNILPAADGGSIHNSYHNVFQIGTSKETATEQIQKWRAQALIERMRGGY